MDYKMFFKKAFSDIRKEHSCPDDETVVNNILERAKTMNNNNENERTYNTQAYEVQPTPTKGHKALSVVAGIAGTAAVLTGAVFGLNWLNEHGGLKEGGIGSSNGAGYHEETPAITAAAKEAAVTEKTEDEETADNETNLTCAPSVIDERYFEETDISFDMSDIQAHLIGYSYDGLMLTAKYELTYPEKLTGYPSRFPTFIDMRETTGEIPFFNDPRYSRFISFDGNKVVIERHILNRFADESFDVLFINTGTAPGGEDLISAKEAAASGNYTVTVHKTFPDSPVIIRDLSEEMPEYTLPDGTVIYPGKLYVSAYGVFIDFEHIDLPAWNTLPITLVMCDGSEISVASESKMGVHTDGNSTDFIGGLFDETIDTRNVVSVNIFGEPFVTFEREADINCFQSFYIPPEEDRMPLTDAHAETEKCDINVNWLAFDGMTLVLQYDVTFKNGLPEDGSVVPIWAFGDNTEKPYTTHGSRVDKLGANGDTVSYIGEIVYNRVIFDEPIKIYFMDDHTWASEVFIPFDEKNTGIIVFMPEELPNIGTSTYNVGKEVTLLSGKKINVESVTLGDYSVMITYDCETVVGFDTNDTYLVMNDGNIIDLDSLENKGGTLVENSQNIYHFILSEKLNIAQVKEIYVCGECVYGDTEPVPTMQQEELPEETIAGDTEAKITE